MKFDNLKTKLFLDSGDPEETRKMLDLLGFVDGQTTNPTLIAKNPVVAANIAKGQKYTRETILHFYKQVITELSTIIPQGSISIEVYADHNTTAEQMLGEARMMYRWVPNAHIKYPTTIEGLKAAELSVKEGIRVNMTLVFSQEQAAAVYAATKGAKKGDIFVSPFIGRLDDKGENGIDLIANIIKMYQGGDHHVEVLTASVRTYDHFLAALHLGSDIITAPLKIYQEWASKGMPIPDSSYEYIPNGLASIEYTDITLDKNWKEYNVLHELTDKGIDRFVTDWNALIG